MSRIPQQEMSIRCTPPEHDVQARNAIGRTSRICQVSLYGTASHVQADYLNQSQGEKCRDMGLC